MPVTSHAVASTSSNVGNGTVERIRSEVGAAIVQPLRHGADGVERRLVRLVG